MNTIILTGFMGSGKTTVGIKLSYQMKKPFLDTDRMIEKEQGREIKEIFAKEGEGYFRKLETQALSELLTDDTSKIISTGGGLPVKEENRKLLKQLGTVIYLKASPEVIYERIKEDTTRPLLQCDDPLTRIRELLADREAAYLNGADYVLTVDDKTFDEILKEIAEAVK